MSLRIAADRSALNYKSFSELAVVYEESAHTIGFAANGTPTWYKDTLETDVPDNIDIKSTIKVYNSAPGNYLKCDISVRMYVLFEKEDDDDTESDYYEETITVGYGKTVSFSYLRFIGDIAMKKLYITPLNGYAQGGPDVVTGLYFYN